MQSSEDTNPTSPTDDEERKIIQEHSCATLAEALNILEEAVKLMEAFEKEYDSVLLSNLFDVDPKTDSTMWDKLDETQKLILSSRHDRVLMETDTTVTYAKNRFKFESPEAAKEFAKAPKTEFEFKSGGFFNKVVEWKASVCEPRSGPSSTPQG